MDDDPMDVYSIFDENDVVSGMNSSYIMSSSEGEDSDSDPFLDPNRDVDLPPRKDQKDIPDAALTMAAHRFASINRGHRKRRFVWRKKIERDVAQGQPVEISVKAEKKRQRERMACIDIGSVMQ